ncbi:hypothetical protein NQ317_014575 [Molorchus minor]|uniref:DUF7041 domain-containing protein n=1 Tax=Molorchus minor TaxID=1323400 RepID=A0ABQ9JUI7_9CUCU|nr:hypothetical protein NQ317_014575 [Molorchus minor]
MVNEITTPAEGSLDSRQTDLVEDIVSSPPNKGKYEKPKTELIKRLPNSSSQRVIKLLEREELGDRKPSLFMRHLRQLTG